MYDDQEYQNNINLIRAEQKLFECESVLEFYRLTESNNNMDYILEEIKDRKKDMNKKEKKTILDRYYRMMAISPKIDKFLNKYEDKAKNNNVTGLVVPEIQYQVVNYKLMYDNLDKYEKKLDQLIKNNKTGDNDEFMKKINELKENFSKDVNDISYSKVFLNKTKSVNVTKDMVNKAIKYLHSIDNNKYKDISAKYSKAIDDTVLFNNPTLKLKKSNKLQRIFISTRSLYDYNELYVKVNIAKKIIKSAAEYNARNIKESNMYIEMVCESMDYESMFNDESFDDEDEMGSILIKEDNLLVNVYYQSQVQAEVDRVGQILYWYENNVKNKDVTGLIVKKIQYQVLNYNLLIDNADKYIKKLDQLIKNNKDDINFNDKIKDLKREYIYTNDKLADTKVNMGLTKNVKINKNIVNSAIKYLHSISKKEYTDISINGRKALDTGFILKVANPSSDRLYKYLIARKESFIYGQVLTKIDVCEKILKAADKYNSKFKISHYNKDNLDIIKKYNES